MENGRTEPPSADADDAALAEVADDRRALVPKLSRTDAWHYLALALLTAIMVWAPATGSVGQFTLVTALGTMWLAWLESRRERTRGVSRPGRRGWAILMAVGVVFIALLATSFALVVAGRAELSLLCAAVTFVAMFVGAWWYDASLGVVAVSGADGRTR